MKVQQVLDITEVIDHRDGCFSLMSASLNIDIWINEDGQNGVDLIFPDEKPVELSDDVLQELYNHINKIAVDYDKKQKALKVIDEPYERDCMEEAKAVKEIA